MKSKKSSTITPQQRLRLKVVGIVLLVAGTLTVGVLLLFGIMHVVLLVAATVAALLGLLLIASPEAWLAAFESFTWIP